MAFFLSQICNSPTVAVFTVRISFQAVKPVSTISATRDPCWRLKGLHQQRRALVLFPFHLLPTGLDSPGLWHGLSRLIGSVASRMAPMTMSSQPRSAACAQAERAPTSLVERSIHSCLIPHLRAHIVPSPRNLSNHPTILSEYPLPPAHAAAAATCCAPPISFPASPSGLGKSSTS